jgi:hypothetical protein
MTGDEFGRALKRVVEARRVALRDNYNFADRPPALSDDCIGISLADLRAALASKDAGPSADVPNTVPSQEGAGSAGGLATRVHVQSPGHNWGSQMWSVVKDDGGLFCLTFYADRAEGGRARETAELIARAVNALPQDAGEPK